MTMIVDGALLWRRCGPLISSCEGRPNYEFQL